MNIYRFERFNETMKYFDIKARNSKEALEKAYEIEKAENIKRFWFVTEI